MTSILGHLLCLVFLLLGLIKIADNLTTTSVQKVWFLGHVLQITPEEHVAECSIKSLKIIDQIGDASTWLQINDDIIHGLPPTEDRYLFIILIFGAPFGNYIKLCHSIQYELRILKVSSKSIQSYTSASNLTKKDEDARFHILTVILPTDKRDDLLDIGEGLSRNIGLPLHSLQVLPEDHPHVFYKQLHSLEVVSSDVSENSRNNKTLFSWVIPTKVYNHTEILKKLKHSQQNHRKRRDIGSNFQWHLVRGHIRVKREIFFGSISALVGTPIESSTLPPPSESSVQTSLYMTSSFLNSDSIPSQTLSMDSSIMALTSEHLSPSEISISSLLLDTVVVNSGKEPDPTIITDFTTSIEPSFTSMPTSVLSKNPSTDIISDSSFRFSTTQTISTDFTLDTSSSISPSMHSDFLSSPINTMSTLNFSFSSQFSKPISNIQINTSTYKSEPPTTLVSSAVVSSSISTGIVSSEFDSTSSFSSSLESINDNSITSPFSSTINSLSSIHSNISYS
uniref:Cnidarian restricted protein n=2 Tax=Clytia hemisphaerica TaxID=252671 RepID=A0A7M5XPA8_9CNID